MNSLALSAVHYVGRLTTGTPGALGLAWRILTAAILGAATSNGQVNVLTFQNDNGRTGQNLAETTLTTQNVNVGTFGKLVSIPVDGFVLAQPLILTNVTIPDKGTHDVLYIVTENDSLYALDAKDGSILWQLSLLNAAAGVTTVPTADLPACTDVGPQIGITSTPVIDPATKTIYVVASTKENGSYFQRLHAIDAATHVEKFGGPVVIQAAVPGTGIASQNGIVAFDPLRSNQRSGLLFINGHIVIAWGSHCDGSPYHGWIMSYNASTLAQETAMTTTPNGSKGGIWMGGAGLAADGNNNLYVAVGDGDYDGLTNWSDSVLKLTTPSLAVSDFFTPYNQAFMQTNNKDLGSSGLLLLPDLPSGTQLLVLGSKLGTIYTLNRNNLGKYCSGCTNTDSQVVQEIPGSVAAIYSGPAYWKGNVYFAGRGDNLKAFAFDAGTGLLSTAPTSQSASVIGYPGATPSVSANGGAAGIVWALDNSTWLSTCCQMLRAFDATNLGVELYNSGQASNNRDVPGAAVKFTVPTVANGHVYVGSQAAVTIYGLLPPAATPIFNPPSGSYSSAQTVSISDSTPGVTIYYTKDGTTPTTSSTVYTAPISVTTTTTIKAIAVVTGLPASNVATATYTLQAAAATPTFSPAPGTYSWPHNISILDTTPGVAIYYTTDGTTPTASSTKYTGAFSVTTPVTVRAIAAGGGFSASAVGSGSFLFQAAQPVFSPAGGSYTVTQTVTLSDTSPSVSIYYTTDGTTPTTSSSVYSGAITVTSTRTLKAIAASSQLAPSTVASALFTIQGLTPAATPTFSLPPGTYSWPRGVTISDSSIGTTIYYTTNGTIPTTASTVYTGSIPLSTATTISAIASGGAFTSSPVAKATYNFQVAQPTLSPAGGSYSTPQSVSISDSSPGVTIYYTTNGATPTVSSTVYTAPIAISKTTTIKAVGARAGFLTSPVATAQFTIP